MAYSGRNKLVGTNRAGALNVDTLNVTSNGAANPSLTTATGTLLSWIQSITYSANTWVIVFKSDYAHQAGTVFSPRVSGTATLFGSQVISYTAATRTLVIGFYNAAGAAAPPPASPAVVDLTACICY